MSGPDSTTRAATPALNTSTRAFSLIRQTTSHQSPLEHPTSLHHQQITSTCSDHDQGRRSSVPLHQDSQIIAASASQTPCVGPSSHPPRYNSGPFRAIQPQQPTDIHLQYRDLLHATPSGVEHPATREKRQQLRQFVDPIPHLYPHLEWYVSDPLYENILSYEMHPPQGFRPPHYMPNHPIFVYYGRDLSNPTSPLPRLKDGRALFERFISGDRTDRGFGPGVIVSNEILPEVGQVEQRTNDTLIYYDVQRTQGPM